MTQLSLFEETPRRSPPKPDAAALRRAFQPFHDNLTKARLAHQFWALANYANSVFVRPSGQA